MGRNVRQEAEQAAAHPQHLKGKKMRVITDHEFMKDKKTQALTLLVDIIDFEEANDPVFLVSNQDDKAYLRRSPGNVLELIGINPEIVADVRKAENIVILELLGEKITHTYSVPTAILEDDEVPS